MAVTACANCVPFVAILVAKTFCASDVDTPCDKPSGENFPWHLSPTIFKNNLGTLGV